MITRKGQATRDRIVVAAAGLMYQQGVAGTSAEDLQAAAGVSASQIYHYFEDKHSLTCAVIGHWSDTLVGFHEPLLARLDDIDALRSWAKVIVDTARINDFRGGCPWVRWLASWPIVTRPLETTSWSATGDGRW